MLVSGLLDVRYVRALTFGLVENQESSDYLKEGDVGFKKFKVC